MIGILSTCVHSLNRKVKLVDQLFSAYDVISTSVHHLIKLWTVWLSDMYSSACFHQKTETIH